MRSFLYGGTRVIDIAYTAFFLAKSPNNEDGGPSDWTNDTLPTIDALIERANIEQPVVVNAVVQMVPRKPTEREFAEILYNINRKRSYGQDLTRADVEEVLDNYFYNVGPPSSPPNFKE